MPRTNNILLKEKLNQVEKSKNGDSDIEDQKSD